MSSCSRPSRPGQGSSHGHPNEAPRRNFLGRSPSRGERGLVNYSRADPESRRIREMSHEILLELKKMQSEEVLLSLQDATCGFVELMNMAAIGSQVLIPIVEVLASACKSTLHRQNLVKLITDTCNSKLASEHLPKYLNKVQDMDDITKMAFLRDMAGPLKSFLNGALSIVPTLATKKLELCVTIFQTSLGLVLEQLPESISAEYKDMLKEMEDMRKIVLQPYIELEKKVNQMGFRETPQNFREIEIAPTAAELHGDADPFLQQNIVAGRYRDGEHYLDVQFRLLREDFVGPLRNGIRKYREIVGAAATDRVAVAKASKEIREMNFYHHVKVQSQQFTGFGIVFVLRFDTGALRNIDWENSKRLLTGSLMCISHDNFENIAVAVVVDRDVLKLKKGLLSVQIIEGRAIVDAPNARQLEFVLAESPALFEAFSPILKGLQALEGDKLPFSKYIIDININMAPPKYAEWDTRFDFSPLLAGFESEDDASRVLSWRRRCTNEESVPILHTEKWPNKEKLGLDVSQYRALQGALTRELAIIQGPPGTGKTFLGLKVVQALVHNMDVWQKRCAPILTVCLTNHALDQFLEGILDQVGNRDIVRVGGQSCSEKLEFYHLREWRRRNAYEYQSRKRPRVRKTISSDLRWQMKELGERMVQHKYLLNTFWQKVIYETELDNIMTDEHSQQMDAFKNRAQAGCGMLVWLGGAITLADLNNENQEFPRHFDILARIAGDNPILAEEDDNLNDNQQILDTDVLQDLFGRITIKERFNNYAGIMEAEEMYNGGWQVATVQLAFSRILRRRMMIMDVMTEQEVGGVQVLNDLVPRDRWRLYRYWVFKKRDEYQAELDRLQRDYEETSIRMKEMQMRENIKIIGNATVVGMTTTGAAKYQTVLQTIKPQIVIVEEAAEVLESHIITALTPYCDHLILIGDHQQLRPSTNMYELARRYKLDVSLFERMINNGIPFETLKLQHRMRPEISRLLVPNIYKELINHPSVEDRPQIRGIAHNVYFINHSMKESDVSDSASKENLFEADYAAALCRHLILQDYDVGKITVLTAYAGQMHQIKKRMKDPVYKGVRVTVVDNYQGEENDIIILSLVRSNAENKIGFLNIENRVCVALSRARNGLYVIGNFDFLMENGGQVWNPIVGHLTTAGLIGPAVRLVCENHTNDVIEAKTAEDFKNAPEGGCTRPCEAIMPCGHICTLSCHCYDTEHVTEKTHCHKPCEKILCERGHGCKRICFQDCGKCNVLVEVVMPACNHTTKIKCSEDPTKVKCLEKCMKDRLCGHKCLDRCHERCSDSCNTPVDVNGPCGHIVQLPCCKKDDIKLAKQTCMARCETELDCGHKCTGTCGRCHQGRFHVFCSEECGRRLVCGHLCLAPCAVACPPCNMQCEIRCIHSKCPNKCGIPCKPCLKKCPWQCAHYQCTQPCWKECDRPPCQEPCRLLLACGHQCIGICGEPCPKKCRVCNRDEVCAVFFGNEEDEHARFVELKDCGHIFEVIAMDHWMNGDKGDSKHREVLMKGCPKCKTVIRKCLRYGSQVKRIMNDVAKIKRRVFGRLQSKNVLSKELTNKCNALHTRPYVRDITTQFKASLRRKSTTLSQYSLLDNLLMLANKPWDILEKIPIGHRKAIQETINDHLQEIMGWILHMIQLNDAGYGSEQQLKQVARELTRVSILSKLLEMPRNGHLNKEARVLYDDVMASVINCMQPFTPEIEKSVIRGINEIKEIQYDSRQLKEEKIEIVIALDMEGGHWFKCPNGHLYAITERGFVYEGESCNKCKSAQTSP